MQGAEQNGSIYLTSDTGILKLDIITGPIQQAGAPRGLDATGVLTVAPGYLADDSAVAYRIIWGTYDANGVLILGPPGARLIVRNSAGASRDVILDFSVPRGLTTGWFYQIYRSEQTITASDTPSDELQLVIEKNLTAGEITAKAVTITDDVIDDFKGAFIYTASTQAGILQSNDKPPLACDITRFRQHMFYANTTQPHRLIVNMGLQVPLDETVTIAGTVYQQRAAENISLNYFKLGADITETMRNLMRVINRSASNTSVYAYEIGDGSFYLEERVLPGSGFTLATSDPTLFITTTPASSAQEIKVNRLYVSRVSQPEAVPITNYLDIGSADKAILRIIDIRDAVFVLKEDGIYRITGTGIGNFIAEQHDSTIEVIGPNTAEAFNNQVFAMSDQGVIAISVTGVAIASRPIERTLLRISEFPNFASTAWAVGYDSDRKYILAVPTFDGDVSATQLFVYNALTQSWTRWTQAVTTGIVSSRNDRLYLGRVSDNQVLEERKSFSLDDYADDEFSVTIGNKTATTVDVTVGIGNVAVGMSLKQGNNVSKIIDVNGITITLATENLPWAAGVAIVYSPIPTILEWVEDHAGNPGILKHYGEITFIFEDARFEEIDALFGSNFLPGFKTVRMRAKGQGAWGLFGWGPPPWGGGLGGFQPIRTYFPKETTRAHWANIRLELSQAFTAFSLVGASMMVEPMTARFK
jgi:hypothetical protein